MPECRRLRCDVDGSDASLARAIARSLVHHVCALADTEVETAEALEVATAELLDEVSAVARVEQLEVDPDFDGIDLVVRTRGPDPSAAAFRPGPVVRATFDSVEVGHGGEIHVRRRIDRRAR